MFDGEQLPYPLAKDDSGRTSTVAFFHEELELNKKWSEENGRPIFDRVIVVTIKARGQKTSEAAYRLAVIFPDDDPSKPADPKLPTRKIYDNIMQRPGVADAFKAWESKQRLADHGTPLETWPIVNRAQVAQLKHVNVFTVEDLAELPDSALPNTGLGLNAREIRAKAQAWLKQAEGGAAIAKLAGRLERLEQADKAKDEEIAALKRENAALKKGKPAPPARPEPAAPAGKRQKTAGAARATSTPFKAQRARAPRRDEDDDIESDVRGAQGELGGEAEDEDQDFI